MAKATKKKESDLRTPEQAAKLFSAIIKASVNTPSINRKNKMNIQLQISNFEHSTLGIETVTLKEGLEKETILFVATFMDDHKANALYDFLKDKRFRVIVIKHNSDYGFCIDLPDLKEDIMFKAYVDDTNNDYTSWIEDKVPLALTVAVVELGMTVQNYVIPILRFDDLIISPSVNK